MHTQMIAHMHAHRFRWTLEWLKIIQWQHFVDMCSLTHSDSETHSSSLFFLLVVFLSCRKTGLPRGRSSRDQHRGCLMQRRSGKTHTHSAKKTSFARDLYLLFSLIELILRCFWSHFLNALADDLACFKTCYLFHEYIDSFKTQTSKIIIKQGSSFNTFFLGCRRRLMHRTSPSRVWFLCTWLDLPQKSLIPVYLIWPPSRV